MPRTLIIDGNNAIHRYHDVYADAAGPICYVGGLFGLVKCARDYVAANPEHDAIIFVIDKGVPAWRFEVCPEYKQQRRDKNAEEQLHYDRYKEQTRHARNLVQHTGCLFASAKGYEGDDVIAALTHRMLPDEGITIMSTDRDYVELVDGDRVKLWSPIKKIYEEANPYYTIERCLDPKESDNLDGVRGVGEVGAAAAVQRWACDVVATRGTQVFPRSSMKALEDFMLWCGEHAKWGVTQKQLKAFPPEQRQIIAEAMATMSPDEKKAYKTAAAVVGCEDKLRANYECTSLRHAARLCEPEVVVKLDPLNLQEFKQVVREYQIRPVLEDFSSYEPIFRRLNNARHAGICRG